MTAEIQIVIKPRQMDKGLENLLPFLEPGEVLICNHTENHPDLERDIDDQKLFYTDIHVISNAGFHAQGYLMEKGIAVVGKIKPEFPPPYE